MRRLLPPDPDGADLDEAALLATYAAQDRRAPTGRPWVLADMVASVDGAATVEGRSGGLGGPGDRAVFHAVRALADVVLVGAGTVRAERYRPPEASAAAAGDRARRGQAPAPRLAVVTGSADLDPALPLFGDPAAPPLVLTTGGADPGRRAALADVAEVVVLAEGGGVDPHAALGALAERGVGIVLCEGGPHLLGQLVGADLVDELCVTVAPTAVAGDASRIAAGPAGPSVDLALAHVLEQGGELYLRYVRAGG